MRLSTEYKDFFNIVVETIWEKEKTKLTKAERKEMVKYKDILMKFKDGGSIKAIDVDRALRYFNLSGLLSKHSELDTVILKGMIGDVIDNIDEVLDAFAISKELKPKIAQQFDKLKNQEIQSKTIAVADRLSKQLGLLHYAYTQDKVLSPQDMAIKLNDLYWILAASIRDLAQTRYDQGKKLEQDLWSGDLLPKLEKEMKLLFNKIVYFIGRYKLEEKIGEDEDVATSSYNFFRSSERKFEKGGWQLKIGTKWYDSQAFLRKSIAGTIKDETLSSGFVDKKVTEDIDSYVEAAFDHYCCGNWEKNFDEEEDKESKKKAEEEGEEITVEEEGEEEGAEEGEEEDELEDGGDVRTLVEGDGKDSQRIKEIRGKIRELKAEIDELKGYLGNIDKQIHEKKEYLQYQERWIKANKQDSIYKQADFDRWDRDYKQDEQDTAEAITALTENKNDISKRIKDKEEKIESLKDKISEPRSASTRMP